jgi:hypothetical protein
MAEFRASSQWSDRDAERFMNYDLNGDGLITAKECLEVDGGGGNSGGGGGGGGGRSRNRGGN